MKYLILIIAAAAGFVAVRVQTNELAKAMYVEGCLDSSLVLRNSGKAEAAAQIERFCTWRKQGLDEFVSPF